MFRLLGARPFQAVLAGILGFGRVEGGFIQHTYHCL